ncbi:MAG TPA: cation:proton antiporter [Candidatus Protoclostridium stercorigallinarum]|uniref:Cation:proton antiporter n=1 Tax=Candidatus Protoclostridium stercorigallinarum TaxID=2838741 RepID=A0A9D1Q012_9FIRM|nr:cation:proton antiporter [Candidatus Protoclostridium stercorigallinarum]
MIDGIPGFLMVLAIVMVSTKLCGLLFRRLNLPQVLGYIIAGVLVGPALIGMSGYSLIGFQSEADEVACFVMLDEFTLMDGGTYTILDVFSKIGVILIMFCAGLETDLKELRKTGLVSTLVACAGVAVPLVLGLVISLPFMGTGLVDDSFGTVIQGLFVGTILTATSVAITVSVLKELGKINTRIGTILVSAAIIDDVIGMVVLSVMTGLGTAGGGAELTGFDWFKAQWWGTVIMIIAFFVAAIAVGIGLHYLFAWMDKKWPSTHRLALLGLATGFAYAFAAEEVFGVADITGAYIAGVMLSTVHRMANYTNKKVDVSSYMIFGPVFFASIGITISFDGLSGWLVLMTALFVLAGLLGKIIGCGAVIKLKGGSWREAGIAGVGMMARGEVALIVTTKGIEAGIIPDSFMIMTVMLILVSSVLTPILLKVLFSGHRDPSDGPEPSKYRGEKISPRTDNDDKGGGTETVPAVKGDNDGTCQE